MRLSPGVLFAAHRKVLTNRTYGDGRTRSNADRMTRLVLWGGPLVLGSACWIFEVPLVAPEAMLAAVALLAAGLVAAFAQLAVWRERLTSERRWTARSAQYKRDLLDEAVTHVLAATYVCVVTAAILVVALNFSDQDGALHGPATAVVAAPASFVTLTLLVVMPKLYVAYATLNDVDDELSGLHRDRTT